MAKTSKQIAISEINQEIFNRNQQRHVLVLLSAHGKQCEKGDNRYTYNVLISDKVSAH